MFGENSAKSIIRRLDARNRRAATGESLKTRGKAAVRMGSNALVLSRLHAVDGLPGILQAASVRSGC